ncbi:FAD-dependent monooxygenase asL4 [Paramyrothecium foliicola]|nr:FAD-dependent monooxygenase asL4 [Paramyrothecium foliicola]
MKILIVGGGITGTALAFWLSKLGHKITVIERHPDLRRGGLQIDVRGHATDVLKRMRLEEAFRSKAIKELGTQFVDSTGRRRAWFPANMGSQSFTAEYEIMRGDLVQLFYDASKDRVKYLFGTSITNFEEERDSVRVRFADETMGQFDLLVGADGQNSRTRKMMMGSDSGDGLHLLQDMVAYYTIPRPAVRGEENVATIYVATGDRNMMVRRSSPQELQVYVGCKFDNECMSEVQRGDVQAQIEAFQEIYKGAGWETEELIRSARNSDNFYCERLGLVKLDSWSKSRVVLAGDAAYCPSPNTGMGTTSGILGAYILAGEIGTHCPDGSTALTDGGKHNLAQLRTALEAYEKALRPFINHVQEGILEDKGWVSIFLMAFFSYNFSTSYSSILLRSASLQESGHSYSTSSESADSDLEHQGQPCPLPTYRYSIQTGLAACYPSSGGIWMSDLDAVELQYLEIDRFSSTERPDISQEEEDAFCHKLRLFDGGWYKPDPEGRDLGRGGHCSALDEYFPIVLVERKVGVPSDENEKGVWILNVDEDTKRFPDGFAAVMNALNMDERVQALVKLGAVYCADIEDCSLLADLRLEPWEIAERISQEKFYGGTSDAL